MLSIIKEEWWKLHQPNEKRVMWMEMVQLFIIDHYQVVLLNNISIDKFK